MKFQIIALLLVSIFTDIHCQDDDVEPDENIEASHLKNPKDNSCGLLFGGAIVQYVSGPYIFSDGLFWDPMKKILMFVDRLNATLNFYHIDTGESDRYYIEELENTELAAVYPVQDQHHKLVILANNSAYVFTKEKRNNEETYSIKKIYDITDESRILTKSCSTLNKHIYVGTKPSDYEEQYPNITKGNAEFIIVDLKNKTKYVMEKGYTFGGGVTMDYRRKYRYHADVIENKIWRRELKKGSDLELVFDMENFKDKLSGQVSAIIIDKSHKLWIGFSYSFQIIQYDPNEQRIIEVIPITASSVTSFAWGGAKFDILFAGTSARYTEDRRVSPAAGAIIAISGTRSRGWYQTHVEVADD